MRQIQKGSVDRSVDLYIIDSTDGTPEVGVLYNTAGIDLKYRRDLSAVVSITEATLAALTTAHTDGGFLEIGNGVYRLDLPDAAWATGADHVTIFGTVTGMIVLPVTVQLVAYDPEAALATPTNITAATGVVLSGVTHTGAVIPTVTTLTGHTAQTGDSFARLGAPAGASVSADVAAVKSETASIQSDTNDIQTRLPAALTGAGNMKSDALAINGNTTSAAVLAILNGNTVVYQGTVTGAATTTTLIDSGLTQADTDWWKGRIIIFTSVITLQATDITAFDPATDKLTFTAVTSAPTGASYVII